MAQAGRLHQSESASKTLDASGKVLQPSPMKKTIFIAAAILVVLVAAALYFLKGSIGPMDAAVLAPEDTVLFVNLNNLPRTAVRWRGTALAKIASEPEMAAFLEKPLARIWANPGVSEAGDILGALKPTALFIAVTNVSANKADALVGFQYWGGRKEFDSAVARMRRQLPAGTVPPVAGNYAGGEILSSQHGTIRVVTATHGRWGFVATSEELVKGAIDRVAGANPGLTGNARFKAVKARMVPDPEFLFFLETGKVIDALLAVGKSMGAEPIPSQVEGLRATEAVGISLKLDGGLQRETMFALCPSVKAGGTLARKPLRFTSADTAFYCNFLGRFDALSTLIEKAKNAAAATSGKAAPQNSELPALAKLAAEAFGPESGIIASWPAGKMAPAPLLAVEVRDAAKAGEFLKKALAFFPDAQITEEDGLKLYSFPSLSNPLATPALAQADGFLLLGLDAANVAGAAHAAGKAPTLESSPAFAGAVSAYNGAGELFAFVDTRMLFERAYTALRPVIIFGAAVMPGFTEWVDPAKLPQTDAVARHLPPIILSQRKVNDGILIESSGPITMGQAVFAITAGTVLSKAPTVLH